jgi:hypothetical protein
MCGDFFGGVVALSWGFVVIFGVATAPALLFRRWTTRRRAIAYALGSLLSALAIPAIWLAVAEPLGSAIDRLRADRWHRRTKEALTLNGWRSSLDPDGRELVVADVTMHIPAVVDFSASVDRNCGRAPTIGRHAFRAGDRFELRSDLACENPERTTSAVPVRLSISSVRFSFPDPWGSPQQRMELYFFRDPSMLSTERPRETDLPLPPPSSAP